MATEHSASSNLPWIWVIEALASFKQVDASLLIGILITSLSPVMKFLVNILTYIIIYCERFTGLGFNVHGSDLVKRTPEISDDMGKNAREMVSFRILESLFVKALGTTNDVASLPDSKIGFESSDRCEDVLRRILDEVI